MDCAFFKPFILFLCAPYCSFYGSHYSICLTYYSNCAPTLSVKKSSSTTPVASYTSLQHKFEKKFLEHYRQLNIPYSALFSRH